MPELKPCIAEDGLNQWDGSRESFDKVFDDCAVCSLRRNPNLRKHEVTLHVIANRIRKGLPQDQWEDVAGYLDKIAKED